MAQGVMLCWVMSRCNKSGSTEGSPGCGINCGKPLIRRRVGKSSRRFCVIGHAEGTDPDVVKLIVVGGNAAGGGVQGVEKPQISGGSAGWGV